MTSIMTGILREIVSTMIAMSPYLLFGFLMAGVLSVLVRPETVEKHLGGRGFLQTVKAAIFGVPLPLCSCGVIPVAASLRRHGAGKGAATSFLISTPQTGVDSIFITFSLLGPVYAIFRPIAAFLGGVIGGTAVNLLGDKKGEQPYMPVCTDECCSGNCDHESRVSRILKYGFHSLPADINKALIAGIVIAGVIGAVVPDDFLSILLGGGIVSMLVMVVLGIPIYVCATASVPIAAALIAKGVSPGAALVFLMTGPATNAATVLTVSKVMGKRTAGIYLGTVAVSAVLFGLLLDAIYKSADVAPPMAMHSMLPHWLGVASSFVLAAVIAGSFFRLPSGRGKSVKESGMTERLVLDIKGMHCNHCVESVKRALTEMPQVASAEVYLKEGRAEVAGEGLDGEAMKRAVEALGYSVTGIRKPGEEDRDG